MIILSQDKKNISDCARVSVERNLGGGKDAKYILIGTLIGTGTFQYSIANYPDEGSAMAELQKICTAFANGEKAYVIE